METTQVLPTEEALNIRPGDLKDIPAIQRIARQAWQAAYREIISAEFIEHELVREYSETALQSQMVEKSHCFLLAELADGEVVGFASYGQLPEGSGAAVLATSATLNQWAKLYKLYLLPDLKGKGYGSALIRAVTDRCRQAGYRQLQLSVNRGNPSVAFYQRQGFSIIREEDVHVGPGFVRYDYVMGKALS